MEIFFLQQKINNLEKYIVQAQKIQSIASNQFKNGILYKDELQEFAILVSDLQSQLILNIELLNNLQFTQKKYCDLGFTKFPNTVNRSYLKSLKNQL